MQAGEGIRLLLIDNVAAFYWLDASVRQMPQEANSAPQSILTLQTVHLVAAASIRMLARQFKLAVLTSKHAFRAPLGQAFGILTVGQVADDLSARYASCCKSDEPIECFKIGRVVLFTNRT